MKEILEILGVVACICAIACFFWWVGSWAEWSEERQRIFDSLNAPGESYEIFLYEQLKIGPHERNFYTEHYHTEDIYRRLKVAEKVHDGTYEGVRVK